MPVLECFPSSLAPSFPPPYLVAVQMYVSACPAGSCASYQLYPYSNNATTFATAYGTAALHLLRDSCYVNDTTSTCNYYVGVFVRTELPLLHTGMKKTPTPSPNPPTPTSCAHHAHRAMAFCCRAQADAPAMDANFSLTFSSPSGANVVPESCLDQGGLCNVPLSQFGRNGRTYEMFVGVSPSAVTLQTESCGGKAAIAVCFAGSGSLCKDPTNPVGAGAWPVAGWDGLAGVVWCLCAPGRTG